MRVAYLAAGASGMYCGSCMHDNRLASTLLSLNRDVVVFPLYTPIRTDEPAAVQGDLYFGGINVFLRERSPVFRRAPRWLERWLDSPKLLKGVGKFAAKTRPEDLGRLTISILRGQHGPQQKELGRLIAALQQVQPDVVALPNLLFAGTAEPIRRALDVPVVCTLSGEDLFLDQMVEPFRSHALDLIARGAESIDACIALSKYYAEHAAQYFSLPAGRVHHIPLGIHVDEFPIQQAPPAGPFVIGFLARVSPEKGLANLVEAFIELRRGGRDCRLRIAGHLTERDRPFWDAIRWHIDDAAMTDAYDYVGEVSREEKYRFLNTLSAFSVPAEQHEPKGFYCVEAMACGIPLVQPRVGAFPEMIDATGGGILYDPDEPSGLAVALASLMDDPARRQELAAAGAAGVRAMYSAQHMAERAWEIYEQVIRTRQPERPTHARG